MKKILISVVLLIICIGTSYLTYTSSEYIDNLHAVLYSGIIAASGFGFLWYTFNTFLTAKKPKE